MQQEVVEAEGHLIDSHVMEQIFDTVVEYNGRFEVEAVPHRPHQRRSVLPAPARGNRRPRPRWSSCSAQLLGLGCSPVDTGDAELATVERDCCAPEDFYSTTNHHTLVRIDGEWIEVREPAHGRHDRRRRRRRASCRRLRDLKAGDRVVVGHARHPRRSRIEGARPPGVRLHEQRDFVGAPGGNRRPPDRRSDAAGARSRARRSSSSPDPWWSTPAASRPLAKLIRGGWVQRAAQRQCAGRARYRIRAARHFARRAA